VTACEQPGISCVQAVQIKRKSKKQKPLGLSHSGFFTEKQET
jgi:hypothetical protein